MGDTRLGTARHAHEGLPLWRYRKDAVLNHHQIRRLALLRRLRKNCGGSALDYGCGYGDMTFRIANGFTLVTGVDVNSDRVAFATAEYAPTVTFNLCTTGPLRYPDGTFDTVLSVVVVNWVDDSDQYLSEVKRVLAPNGKFVIIASAVHPLNRWVRRILRRPVVPQNFKTIESTKLIRSCEKLGFKVEAIDCFYESLFAEELTVNRAVMELIGLPFRLLHIVETAPYFGVRFSREG